MHDDLASMVCITEVVDSTEKRALDEKFVLATKSRSYHKYFALTSLIQQLSPVRTVQVAIRVCSRFCVCLIQLRTHSTYILIF